jgi:hypothetical protein
LERDLSSILLGRPDELVRSQVALQPLIDAAPRGMWDLIDRGFLAYGEDDERLAPDGRCRAGAHVFGHDWSGIVEIGSPSLDAPMGVDLYRLPATHAEVRVPVGDAGAAGDRRATSAILGPSHGR